MTSQSSEISKMVNEPEASVSLTSAVRLYSHSPKATANHSAHSVQL